jgi:hypothetical protein
MMGSLGAENRSRDDDVSNDIAEPFGFEGRKFGCASE